MLYLRDESNLFIMDTIGENLNFDKNEIFGILKFLDFPNVILNTVERYRELKNGQLVIDKLSGMYKTAKGIIDLRYKIFKIEKNLAPNLEKNFVSQRLFKALHILSNSVLVEEADQLNRQQSLILNIMHEDEEKKKIKKGKLTSINNLDSKGIQSTTIKSSINEPNKQEKATMNN